MHIKINLTTNGTFPSKSINELAQKVSIDCKNREWYCLVAPIMLKEIAKKVTGKEIHHLSKYMLLDYTILPEYQEV